MGGTERPDINKRATQASGDLGPGAYNGGKNFGKEVVGFSWGKPKADRQDIDDRDYNVSPEKFAKTRFRSPSATISRNVPARRSFVNLAQADVPDAGMYEKKNEFGKNVTTFSWGNPKVENVEVDNRDYDVDKFTKTRHRSPAAIINQNSPSRPQTLAHKLNCEVESYDAHKKFGGETKNMSFAKTPRNPSVRDTSAGPGHYDLDKSEGATRYRI